MKIYFTIILLFIASVSFAQKDSILIMYANPTTGDLDSMYFKTTATNIKVSELLTCDTMVYYTKPLVVVPRFNTNTIPYRWGLGFISGAARGLNQVVAFHPDRFFERYPNANRLYWDNSISWRNKYKNGDPEQGPAFPFATTGLAWTTDAFHFTGTSSNATGVVSLSIPLYSGSGKKLKHYVAEVGFSAVGYWMGFHSVYSLWFP
jgi:hypothetical protein